MLSNNKNEISSSHVIEVGSVPIQLKSQQVQIWDRSHGSNPNSSHVLDLLGHCPSWAMYPNEATEPQHSAILLNSILKIPQNVNWQKCLPTSFLPILFPQPYTTFNAGLRKGHHIQLIIYNCPKNEKSMLEAYAT